MIFRNGFKNLNLLDVRGERMHMTCKIIYCCAQSTKIHDVYGPIFLKATLIFQNFKIVHNADIFLTKKLVLFDVKLDF